jgi:cell division inhibitor SepF
MFYATQINNMAPPNIQQKRSREMGILDNVKNRFSKNQDDDFDKQYDVEEEYYFDDEGFEDDSDFAIQDESETELQPYAQHQSGVSRSSRLRANRSEYALDSHAPLISMTDVRSQGLPPLSEARSSARTSSRTTSSRINAGAIGQSSNFPVYELADNTPDPLLQRHSLSNTGNFDSTSPAYYASRSGVGKVRGTGTQSSESKQNSFRETIVIRPQNYAAAEQIASNLRQGNAVVIVLAETRPELAKRILDFGFGAAAALEGQVSSPADRIYVFTNGYALTAEEQELLQARGVL